MKHIKQIVFLIVIGFSALTFAACGATPKPEAENIIDVDQEQYGTYSREGNVVKFREQEPNLKQMVQACAPNAVKQIQTDNGQYHPDVVYVVCETSKDTSMSDDSNMSDNSGSTEDSTD